MTALVIWILLSCCLLVWAVQAQWQIRQLRRRNRVAFSVISHWRNLAMDSYRHSNQPNRFLSAGELAERIADNPLTREQQVMMRKVLRARRNVGGRQR